MLPEKYPSQSLSDNYQLRNTLDVGQVFEVTGYELVPNSDGQNHIQHFQYLTKNVVLATGKCQQKDIFLSFFFSGQTDLPNRLGVAGENLPFVLHNLRELEKIVEIGNLTKNSDPVMIVGAGLSAADAIISTQVRFYNYNL